MPLEVGGKSFQKLFCTSAELFPLFFFIKLHVYIDLRKGAKPFTSNTDLFISRLPALFRFPIQLWLPIAFEYIWVFVEKLVGQNFDAKFRTLKWRSIEQSRLFFIRLFIFIDYKINAPSSLTFAISLILHSIPSVWKVNVIDKNMTRHKYSEMF